ncbi:uncharacterized protein LOC142335392 [Convolutriloba macropyga]|uniref:uncharacterized protein LOC142335392 n=1 Tax=Convolutriloba macropyga TaxID=536237 RepID=UPI003F525F7C
MRFSVFLLILCWLNICETARLSVEDVDGGKRNPRVLDINGRAESEGPVMCCPINLSNNKDLVHQAVERRKRRTIVPQMGIGSQIYTRSKQKRVSFDTEMDRDILGHQFVKLLFAQ